LFLAFNFSLSFVKSLLKSQKIFIKIVKHYSKNLKIMHYNYIK